MRLRLVWLGLFGFGLIVVASIGWGQAPVLQRLADQSAAYRKELPDITCEEKAVSVAKHRSTELTHVQFGATIRVLREDDGHLQESFVIDEYEGRPVTGPGVYPMPTYVQGGFARGMAAIFGAEKQACFRYKAGAGRIDFEAVAFGVPCDEPKGTKGFALLDGAGDVTHIETRRDPDAARRVGMTSFTVINYATVALGDASFRLPVKLYAEMKSGSNMRTFAADYAACNRFHATVTVRAAEPE